MEKIVVFDSHPVQYRVPVWKHIETHNPGLLHVVYGSDCSVRGHADEGFGRKISWDEPMLEGYSNTVMNCEKGKPLSGWGSLTGKGIGKLMDELKPSVVLLVGLNYKYDLVAYLAALRRGIPVWLRCETQDEASHRSRFKGMIRSLIYRVAYLGIARVFYIGQLNKQHYLKHGVGISRLFPAHYATVDRFAALTTEEKDELRKKARAHAGIGEDDFVIGFSGKLIPKKNPDILYAMLEYLPETLRRKACIYFLGSGEMEQALKEQADKIYATYHVKSFFAGFVNQSDLPGHYLAMDIMVLPSRKMGETWGLVSNEAMQAGCGVIVTDVVGSGADFASWERFRVFKEADAKELANAVIELSQFQRSYDWAQKGLTEYSIEAIAQSLSGSVKK